jgi:hypothetical protein
LESVITPSIRIWVKDPVGVISPSRLHKVDPSTSFLGLPEAILGAGTVRSCIAPRFKGNNTEKRRKSRPAFRLGQAKSLGKADGALDLEEVELRLNHRPPTHGLPPWARLMEG